MKENVDYSESKVNDDICIRESGYIWIQYRCKWCLLENMDQVFLEPWSFEFQLNRCKLILRDDTSDEQVQK